MANIFPDPIENFARVGYPRIKLGPLELGPSGMMPSGSPSVVYRPTIAHVYLGKKSIKFNRNNVGVPSVYQTSDVPQVHSQVEYQVPSFIKDEHEAFVSFMREYYRFSENQNGPLYFLRRLLNLQDIDKTNDELLEYFYREYAPTFPRNVVLTPATIIKNIKQFYVAKGSEKSFQFLFRVFFGCDVEFIYPRLDILKFSDGKWIQDRSIKTSILEGNPLNLAGNRIIGSTSRASAFVEKVTVTQDGPITVYELFLNASSVIGKFELSEEIKDEDGTVKLILLPSIVKIQIDSPGVGYKINQEVRVIGSGFNCKARVNSVGALGEVLAVQIYQFGAGYVPGTTTVQFPVYEGVTTAATGTVQFDSLLKYPGYFLNSDGMFSSLKPLQDGYYWQQFSYVIRSSESRDRYENVVKNLVHPAGLIFFSEVVTESVLETKADLVPDLNGNIATEFEIFTDLRHDYPEFVIPITEYVYVLSESSAETEDSEMFMEDVTYGDGNVPLGPNWNDWDKWKMDYRPTPTFGLPIDEIVEPNHFALYAHTPLKVWADVKLWTIAFEPLQQIEHLPETTIHQMDTRPGVPQLIMPKDGTGQTASVGTSIPIKPSAIVFDGQLAPVANVIVVFTVVLGNGRVIDFEKTTDATGVARVGDWILGTTLGVQQISASIKNRPTVGSAKFSVNAKAGPASLITIVSGDGQTANVGTALPLPLVVRVTDAYGNPVSGHVVSYKVTSGNGTISQVQAITDASGLATLTRWTIGMIAGGNLLTATINGTSGPSVTFTATGEPGGAAQILIYEGDDQVAPVATSVPLDPSVQVLDENGNPVAGIVVTFEIEEGDGSVN